MESIQPQNLKTTQDGSGVLEPPEQLPERRCNDIVAVTLNNFCYKLSNSTGVALEFRGRACVKVFGSQFSSNFQSVNNFSNCLLSQLR